MTEIEQLSNSLSQLGFANVDEILKNKKIAVSLGQIVDEIAETRANSETSETPTHLLMSLASLSKGETISNRKLVVAAILDGKLTSELKVKAALNYVKAKGDEASSTEMELESGVGIEVSDEQLEAEVSKYIAANKAQLETERYKLVPTVLNQVKAIPSLKWASPAAFKPVVDAQILALLGPKDERDIIKKEKKKAAPKEKTAVAAVVAAPVRSMFSEGFLGDLHKPGENAQAYPELMKEHLAFTKGSVMTRFPPEPNGYLHIGHSKAIMVNFGYAAYHNGKCYLRFDDTNPEAEEEQFFKSIESLVGWLGYKPWKITYSSDYFDQLYDLAEKLISADGAYVCHCGAEEVKKQRGLKDDGTPGGERFACSHRTRPVAESLTEFRRMRDGAYLPGEATLRMKQDLTSPSPQMWDLVAYRVLNAPHHRTGDKWKIYPTYDFTHCLVDSFENISHSLCTTEFRLSRESYEWLCDAVHVYRPAQREYGRLNITGTIMSKRKIAKLVTEGYVRGWDDPRLYTLESLKRRGVPPGAILSFINTLGVTTSVSNIQAVRFESAVRSYLDQTTPRLMMILDPIEVVFNNLADDYEEVVEIPYKPGSPSFGSRRLPFTKKIYIDRSDYRDEISKDYFRLAPGQSVGLMKVPFTIRVESVVRNEDGSVKSIHAIYENGEERKKKPKTYIQWIPESSSYKSPVHIKEVRVHNQLFLSENPSAHVDGYLADINPDSEEIIKGALLEPSFFDLKEKSPLNYPSDNERFNIKEAEGSVESARFQALRVGYFCLDKDSAADEVILNRVVTLKEDSSKD